VGQGVSAVVSRSEVSAESGGAKGCPKREQGVTMPKAFATLAARAALRAWQLWRSDAADGPQRFFAGRWGMVRVLADLDDVEQFLERVGVRP